MYRKLLTTIFWCVAGTVTAVGIGWYVYPVRPALVWALLIFCAICYLLHLRARALFGQRGAVEDSHPRSAAIPRRPYMRI